jgi:hypothetical protein
VVCICIEFHSSDAAAAAKNIGPAKTSTDLQRMLRSVWLRFAGNAAALPGMRVDARRNGKQF